MTSATSGKFGMRRVSVSLADGRDFQRHYMCDAPHGGLVFDSSVEIEEGELLELWLRFEDRGREFPIQGTVLWCRREEGQVRRKTGVAFLATETNRRETLLAMAGDDAPPPSQERLRRERRFETTLKVIYETNTDFVVDYTRNLSTGGLFVNSRHPPAMGTDILFKLYPPGEPEPIDLPGKVAWRRPGQGFGVRFEAASPVAQARLDRLVRSLSVGDSAQVRAPIVEEVRS